MNTKTICNKCGQTVRHTTNTELDFGYGSQFDAERWEFSLCDDCLGDFISTFKQAPTGFGQHSHTPELTSEQHQETFDNWKQTGKWEEMMCIPYDKLIAFRDYYEDEYINNCIMKYHPEKPLLQ